MLNTKAQIVATVGPASVAPEIFTDLVKFGVDVARLNCSWGDQAEKLQQIEAVRAAARVTNKTVPIILDLSGPRIQEGAGHTYDSDVASSLTERDQEFIRFGIAQRVEYFALSFVGSAVDVLRGRELIKQFGGQQKVIAKIERQAAVNHLDEIIVVADAVMVARGDLGSELPLEKIPFVQAEIIRKCKELGKPVITATQMMFSMAQSPVPTRAEVTDVATAILQGSDAVMLSEETASGKYPREAVTMMNKIIMEAEHYLGHRAVFNSL